MDKAIVLQRYKQLVSDRIDAFRDMISALTADAQNDAKGSAGDKHETALSMMHIEQEKLNAKLSEFLAQKAILDRIDPLVQSKAIALGSLVEANGMLLFVSSALPKISIDGTSIIALSPESPLGQNLIGRETGHSFTVGTTNYSVSGVF